MEARGFQVVEGAATGALDLEVDGLPFAEQAVAVATMDSCFSHFNGHLGCLVTLSLP